MGSDPSDSILPSRCPVANLRRSVASCVELEKARMAQIKATSVQTENVQLISLLLLRQYLRAFRLEPIVNESLRRL